MPTNATYGTSKSGFQMSGLISGLDTEDLVKQMSMATKNKINKNQQKLDLLSWKQESYRSVIDKISTFKKSYLNALSPKTYLKSKSLFSAYKASSSNDLITAIASPSSKGESFKISRIDQLAEKATMESVDNISSGIKLDLVGLTENNDYELQINLDGLTKTVSFKGGADTATTTANFQSAIQKSFGNEFVINDNVLTYNKNDGIAHNFSINSNDLSNLKSIGLSEATSNRINGNTKIKDINFKEVLAGGSFTFTINDKKFSFDRDATVNDIIDKVNSSNAGVKLSFNSLSQKFKLQSDEEGAASSIKIEQTNGNLLSAMFGKDKIGASGNISSVSLMDKTINGTEITNTDFSKLKNKTFNVTVNGVTKTIGLWGYDSNGVKVKYEDQKDKNGNPIPGTRNTVSMLNREMERAFGSGTPKFSYDETMDKDGHLSVKISIKGNAGDVIKLSESKVDDNGNIIYDSDKGDKIAEGSGDLLKALGFDKAATNQLNQNTTLASVYGKFNVAGTTLKVNNKVLTIDENTTLKAFNDTFGEDAKIDFDTGIISLKGSMTATDEKGQKLIERMFDTSYDKVSNYTSSGKNGTVEINGKNAILTVNDVKITNNSNQININGTTINIENAKELTGIDLVGKNEINITSHRDTKDAFDAVVKFIDDYNNMIDELNKEVRTMRPTDNGRFSGTKYEPLTEEQREEMSDKEIEKWEEKAKTGLLYQDQNINNFLTTLRRSMSTATSDKFNLNDMGITVSTNYKDNGKLEIDEEKLKVAFEKNPEQIQELFTGESGLMSNVENAIERTIGTSAGKYGSLVRIAGIKDTSTQANNTISRQITTYSDMIRDLKDKYAREQERYWKQFTNLEKVMNDYNTQAGWLAQQFGGGMM